MCCTDCELVALLEDDTGMELLVCNKIVSLDLPVKDVFKKIWCTHSNVRRPYFWPSSIMLYLLLYVNERTKVQNLDTCLKMIKLIKLLLCARSVVIKYVCKLHTTKNLHFFNSPS